MRVSRARLAEPQTERGVSRAVSGVGQCEGGGALKHKQLAGDGGKTHSITHAAAIAANYSAPGHSRAPWGGAISFEN